MTREEAFAILQYQYENGQMNNDVHEALGMAINALSDIGYIKYTLELLPTYAAKFNDGSYAIHIDKDEVLQIINKRIESEEV